MNPANNIKLGILYAIGSAFSFAVMSLLVKLIGNHLPITVILFARFGLSLILILPWLLRDKTFKVSLRLQKPVMFFLRSLMPLCSLSCTFYAIKFIPLVDALLLNSTAPLFVPLIALLITGARTPFKAILGIMLGFVGVAIILNPGHELLQLPSVIALSAGLFAAIAIVLLRLLSKIYTTNELLFYYFSTAALISGIAAAIQWQTPENGHLWLLLLGVGIFGTLYQVLATLSYSKAPVRLMSPFMFFMIIFGGLFDWALWGQIPTLETISGMLLIIAGTIITIYFGQREIHSTSHKGTNP